MTKAVVYPAFYFFCFPKVFIDFISVSLSSESVSAELCGGATEARPTVVALQRLGEMVGGGNSTMVLPPPPGDPSFFETTNG